MRPSEPARAEPLPLFLRAPHRVMFLAGAAQALLAMTWWALALAGRLGWTAGAAAAGGTWPAPWVHATLLTYGVFPFFIFGFLMTAGPRWQGAPPLARAAYLGTALPCIAGWSLFYAALFEARLLPSALALVLCGWGVAVAALAPVAWREGADRRALRLAVGALGLGAAGISLLLAVSLGAPAALAPPALALGLWCCLLPVFVVVSHRMIPFFSGAVLRNYSAVRPAWALQALLAAALGHGFLAAGGLSKWFWLADLPAAAVALYLSRAWQFRRAMAVKLLAMLHIGFAWFGVAMLVSGLQSLAALAGLAAAGLAPLHALTIGFFSAMVLGMASRVTLGHSGRQLATDRATWFVFLGMQAAALLRIAADYAGAWGAWLLLASALGWLGCFAGWCRVYVPMLWLPRADGQPG